MLNSEDYSKGKIYKIMANLKAQKHQTNEYHLSYFWHGNANWNFFHYLIMGTGSDFPEFVYRFFQMHDWLIYMLEREKKHSFYNRARLILFLRAVQWTIVVKFIFIWSILKVCLTYICTTSLFLYFAVHLLLIMSNYLKYLGYLYNRSLFQFLRMKCPGKYFLPICIRETLVLTV